MRREDVIVTDDQYEGLSMKLNTLIRLIALSIIADKKRPEQFMLLSNAGLQPKEIAEIVGTTPNTVRVVLSKIRKEMKSRR